MKKLLFEKDKQRSGTLTKGYVKNWNWSKGKGSYNLGKDFLSVHWEIRDATPNVVRLHIESPGLLVDPHLNALKMRLIVNVLAKIFDIAKALKAGQLKVGSRLPMAHRTKSSEVFQVSLDKKLSCDTPKERITGIHAEIGYFIDQAVSHCMDDIKKQLN